MDIVKLTQDFNFAASTLTFAEQQLSEAKEAIRQAYLEWREGPEVELINSKPEYQNWFSRHAPYGGPLYAPSEVRGSVTYLMLLQWWESEGKAAFKKFREHYREESK